MHSIFKKFEVSENYQCTTCNLGFDSSLSQRLHFKSNWHIYNLNRKVANLPVLSSDEYNARFGPQSSENVVTNFYCKCCKKSFSSRNSYDCHNTSKKHQKKSKDTINSKSSDSLSSSTINDVIVPDIQDEDINEEDWEDLSSDDEQSDDKSVAKLSLQCLFCRNYYSKDVTDNLKHMSEKHSFFVPYIQYCVDLDGLICYLSNKIRKEYMCIWCNNNGKSFKSADSVLNHMESKGHCKMLHEDITIAEYMPFYDYSQSYPDAGEGHSDEEVEDSDEIQADEYSLVLPSGVEIGHRSLMKYYKQYFDSNAAISMKVNVKKSHKKLNPILSHYRSLGWDGAVIEASKRKKRDIKHMQQAQNKFKQQLGVKSNKLHKIRPNVVF